MKPVKAIMLVAFISLCFLISACSPPVDLQGFNGDKITVKGKHYVLKGKVKKHHDLLINGWPVELRPDKTFEKKLILKIGDNKYTLEIAPKSRDKDSFFREIVIRREMYPAEIEYAKASCHKPIHWGRCDDFAIDKNGKYLVTSYGHGSPCVYDLNSGILLRQMEKPDRACGYHQAVTFTPDNKHVIVGLYWMESMYIYDSNNFKLVKKRYIRRGGHKFAISYAANAIVTSSNGIWKIDPNSFNIIGGYQPNWAVDIISFDPTGKYLASDVSSTREVGTMKITRTDKLIKNISYKNWEATERKIAKKYKIATGHIKAIVWHGSGSEIIAGSSNGEIVVCNFNRKNMKLKVAKIIHLGVSINSLALNIDNTILVAATKNSIVVFDYPSLRRKITFDSGASKVLFANAPTTFYYLKREGVFSPSLDGINWPLIKEYFKLKRANII